jgi:hypothetical protein
MRIKVNMVGGGFQHDICSSAGYVPTKIEWTKDLSSNISIHIDNAMFTHRVNKRNKNYAWIVEARSIIPGVYSAVENNISFLEQEFDYIFTHDKSLMSLSNKIKFVICNSKPWVGDFDNRPKSKKVSMIASSKIMCNEHLYRQHLIQKFKNQVDHFGRGFNEIKTKDEGLFDYKFSVAIENGNYDTMFTEKLTDCFASKTIPIYWGTRSIEKFFNPDGVIFLDDNTDIKNLDESIYYDKMKAIEENFDITNSLPIAEDYLCENYLND